MPDVRRGLLGGEENECKASSARIPVKASNTSFRVGKSDAISASKLLYLN